MFSKDSILERMGKHLSSPVLWTECMSQALKFGINDFVEIGPKPVLSSFFKGFSKSVSIKFLFYLCCYR